MNKSTVIAQLSQQPNLDRKIEGWIIEGWIAAQIHRIQESLKIEIVDDDNPDGQKVVYDQESGFYVAIVRSSHQAYDLNLARGLLYKRFDDALSALGYGSAFP